MNTMSVPRSDPDEKVPGHTSIIDTNLIETHASDLSSSDIDEKKNGPPVKEVAVSSVDEGSIDLTSDEFADIPELVRNIVSFEDDATLPVITFRSVLLSIVFCVLGSFVSQLS